MAAEAETNGRGGVPLERHDTSNFDCDSGKIDDDELLFGYGWFTPSWLQWHHNAKFLLLWLGLCAFVQSFVVNAVFPAGLSTLEKQFKMTSTSTGIISSWYDVAVLLVVFPICHFGRHAHKGRWIGVGGVVMALGSFVCALPHFLSPIYDPLHLHTDNSSDNGGCHPNQATSHAPLKECSQSPFHILLNPHFLLFILGQTLHGIGSTPLFSIGTAYIDENVSQSASPLYLALHALITSLGPVVGLFSAAFFLGTYVDFDRVDEVPITSNDGRWLGAWWVGFVIGSLAALLVALPILGFARELPEARRHRSKDVNQAHASSQAVADKVGDGGGVQATMGIFWGILRNPTFLVITVIGIAEGIIINGFSAFMPKVLETLLGVNPMSAGLLSSVVIVAAAVGLVTGGSLVRRLKLQVPGMFKFLVVCEVVSLLFLACFFVHCPSRKFVGINEAYEEETMSGLLSTCNSPCQCTEEWNPVCDQTKGIMYFSACHAGCSTVEVEGNSSIHEWRDCSCLTHGSQRPLKAWGEEGRRGEGKECQGGYCDSQCGDTIYVFMTLLFFLVVVTFASGIPTQQIMLRVVPFDHRTVAIGMNWTLLRLLGFIPGGILFGAIIDKSCVKWSEGCTSSCLVYDPANQSWTIFALAVVCKLVAVLGSILGYLTYTPSLEGEGAASLATVDSHGPLSLVVNDDRQPPGEQMHR